MIEVGVILALYDDAGIGEVIDVYSALRQPDKPISTKITQITGITNAMVAGHRIDAEALASFLSRADLIVAHNAAFDRPFVERLCPNLGARAWACSSQEVDWQGLGFEGSKLSHLVGQCGWFHDGHRASVDCAALLRVLDTRLPKTDETPFHYLLRSARQARSRIYAQASPFSAKDRLKARGYRWNDGNDGRPRSWWINVPDAKLESEIRFLQDEIYCYEVEPPVVRLTAWERYRIE
ncbi:hypothetical protein ASF65_13980 [Aureimonas sp. Leaf324]|nr:hypothetical protein ASF65_13980 [Aureimonas sp. Leaf324]